MARSQYIYLITSPSYDGVIAAFTVKHEAITALKKLREDPSGKYLELQRVRDNGEPWGETVFVEIED